MAPSSRRRSRSGASSTPRVQASVDSMRADYEHQLDAKYAAARGFVDAIVTPEDTRDQLAFLLAYRANQPGRTSAPSSSPLYAESGLLEMRLLPSRRILASRGGRSRPGASRPGSASPVLLHDRRRREPVDGIECRRPQPPAAIRSVVHRSDCHARLRHGRMPLRAPASTGSLRHTRAGTAGAC